MIEIKSTHIFNCCADDYLNSSLNENYPDYLVNNEDQMLECNIEKTDKNDNIIFQEKSCIIKIYLPSFITKIVGNKSFKVKETSYTDFDNKTKKIIIESKLFSMLKSNMETMYLFEDIDNNKCKKTTIIKYRSSFPILKKKIEEYSVDRIRKQNENNNEISKKWINFWKENYKSLSVGLT